MLCAIIFCYNDKGNKINIYQCSNKLSQRQIIIHPGVLKVDLKFSAHEVMLDLMRNE